jgi:hypothetical protein
MPSFLWSLADEVFVRAIQYQFAALIMHRGAHHDHAGGPLRQEFGDFQRRIKRVAGVHALEEAAGLLDETHERVVDLVREQAGAGRGLDQHLEAVREQVRHSARAAEFAVVVNRMVVAARRLEGEEMRVAHGTAGQAKHSPTRNSNQRARPRGERGSNSAMCVVAR